MMKFLKNHPFAVEAHFESSLVLTFAVPKVQLQELIPDHLELDHFQDKWAFIAIAMVQTKGLRPKGFPKFLGSDFFLIGYRIFVRYQNKAGKRLRGLYIIKSQTDKKRMEFFGNLFTHYNYSTTDIEQKQDGKYRSIKSNQSHFEFVIDTHRQEVGLPAGSPFSNWAEARKFAGPLPHTFTVNSEENSVLTILGVRKKWNPHPLKVENYYFKFLDSLNLEGIQLANAFEIKNLDYYWEKGKIEKWN